MTTPADRSARWMATGTRQVRRSQDSAAHRGRCRGLWLLTWSALLVGCLLAPQAMAQDGPRPATGQAWLARASYVVDGDSLWVRPSGGARRVRLRLEGIDAPEICQRHGPQARSALLALVQDEPLRVSVRAYDRFGRGIAAVQRQRDGMDVAAGMVERGWAWSDAHGWRRGRYESEEAAARAAGRGVFAAHAQERPAEFRRRHGPCERPAATPAPRR